MSEAHIWLSLGAFLLVVLAGIFAAIDASLLRVSKARVAELHKEGRRGAASLLDVVEDLPKHTNLLLLLRLVCELTAVVIATVVIAEWVTVAWQLILIAAAGMTVISYILVGVGPRTLGRQHPYAIALPTAAAVRALGVLLGPVARLLILIGNAITPGKGFREGPFSTETELRELLDLAEQRGVVEHEEREMLHSVFDLGDTIVREVMVPRTDVVWIEAGKSAPQALALSLRSGFSRIPVIGENIDDVVGVIYLKDVVRRTQSGTPEANREIAVADLMRPATFVPESKPVDDLLREMQLDRSHMALVVDEYGGLAGLVTIEDILEEIVGEIADEYDMHEKAPIEQLDDGRVRMQSRVQVEDLAETFDVDLDITDDVETVGGLMAEKLGLVPIPGATVEVAGLRLTAEGTAGRRNRIDSILIERIAHESIDTDEHDTDDARSAAS